MIHREIAWTMIEVISELVKIVAVDSHQPDKRALSLATELIRSGSVIVAPTDTRYALVARADSATALARVFEIKERSDRAPSAIFVSSVEEIWKFGKRTDAALRLANEFLPGPLTLVLSATEHAARELPQALITHNKIGVRVPDSPLIRALVEAVQAPLTATSANLSGSAQSNSAQEIAAEFTGEVALVLDGGRLAGKVSSVVDCSQSGAVMLREGAISQQRLDRAHRP
ncbi:MAG: threonylcarbamoyl-AMP synthase [candidate division Zixibacteria bacterium]|nr:threonylcarbamoyl-AMP synthase [candidate division Zixibacteria bacterium]